MQGVVLLQGIKYICPYIVGAPVLLAIFTAVIAGEIVISTFPIGTIRRHEKNPTDQMEMHRSRKDNGQYSVVTYLCFGGEGEEGVV